MCRFEQKIYLCLQTLLILGFVVLPQPAFSTCIESAVCLNSQFEEEIMILLAASENPEKELTRLALEAQQAIFTREVKIHLELCPEPITDGGSGRRLSELCGVNYTYAVEMELMD